MCSSVRHLFPHLHCFGVAGKPKLEHPPDRFQAEVPPVTREEERFGVCGSQLPACHVTDRRERIDDGLSIPTPVVPAIVEKLRSDLHR